MRSVFVAAAVAAGSISVLVDARSSLSSSAAVLTFRAELMTDSPAGSCPPEAPADADCHPRTGKGSVSGFGQISATYNWFYARGSCTSTLVKPLATTARFVVAGKGTIELAIADGARCVEQEPVRNEPQGFSITGGTGKYQGASGQGTLERSLSGGTGVEWWSGTLTVPGLDFDTAPPAITGAVGKTVRVPARAKRVRVNYRVTATDAADGAVAASCFPRSGTFFAIGRTIVTCNASDTSGNESTARFSVTVRR